MILKTFSFNTDASNNNDVEQSINTWLDLQTNIRVLFIKHYFRFRYKYLTKRKKLLTRTDLVKCLYYAENNSGEGDMNINIKEMPGLDILTLPNSLITPIEDISSTLSDINSSLPEMVNGTTVRVETNYTNRGAVRLRYGRYDSGNVTTSTRYINSGERLTLDATPINSNFALLKWTHNDIDGTNDNPLIVTKDSEGEVYVAIFEYIYTLTYTAGANGSITGSTTQIVFKNASGSAVTAIANPGYHFVNWSDASTNNPRTDTNVTANISVTANFESD